MSAWLMERSRNLIPESGEAYWKERSVNRIEDDVDGRASVTKCRPSYRRAHWPLDRLQRNEDRSCAVNTSFLEYKCERTGVHVLRTNLNFTFTNRLPTLTITHAVQTAVQTLVVTFCSCEGNRPAKYLRVASSVECGLTLQLRNFTFASCILKFFNASVPRSGNIMFWVCPSVCAYVRNCVRTCVGRCNHRLACPRLLVYFV